jgi:hypothetical protein
VLYDSERASLTVAQPYKDVFNAFFFWFSFVDFWCQSETLTSESILQNHNLGQIQVFFYD